MKRVIIDYKKLTPEILSLLTVRFPDGYGDNDIITFSIPNKEVVEAVEVKTDDTIYLVKVGSKLKDTMVNFLEEDEEDATTKANVEALKIAPEEAQEE